MRELPFFAGEEARGNILVLLFFVSAFVITVWGTWEGVLPAGDEAVLAATAREIVATGDLLPMRLGGEPARGTPPLAPWLMALFFKLFGINDFAARFAFVILSIAASWVLLAAGREASRDLTGFESVAAETREIVHPSQWRTINAAVGVLAAIILAATPLFGRFAPHVTTGLPFAFSAALALLGWLYLPGRRGGAILWGIGIAGAVLSVGAGGFLIVAGAAIASIVEKSRRRIWRMPSFIAATACGLVAGGLWLLPAAARSGGFPGSPLWSPIAALAQPGANAGRAFFSSAANTWLRCLPWSIPATLAVARVLFYAGERRRRWAVAEIDSALIIFMTVLFVPLALAGTQPVSAFLVVAPFVALLAARDVARWAVRRGRHPIKRVWIVNHVLTALFCLLMLLVLSTIVSIRRSSADPIREIACVAGRIAQPDASIGNYRQSLRIQGARVLFYGGRSLDEPVDSPAAVAAAFAADPDKLFFSSVADLESLRESGDFPMEIRVLYGAGDLVLFGAQRTRGEAP